MKSQKATNRESERLLKYFSESPIKGGAGSGNFGHAGRPGLVGGSAREAETLEITWSGSRSLRNQVEEWEGERMQIGMFALEEIRSKEGSLGTTPYGMGLVDPETGEIMGVSVYEIANASDFPVEIPGGQYLTINYLATKESGWGRTFMQKFIDEANKNGMGVALLSSPSAVGFYQAIGMRSDDGQIFYWTPSEISVLATKRMLSEPENGVFVGKPISKRKNG